MTHAADRVIDRLSDGELGFQINAVRGAIWNAIQRELAPMNITTAQFVLFYLIALGKGRTISDFSRIMAYDSGAMTRLAARIERKGLIRRIANPDDRRSALVELTPVSAALVPDAKRRVHAAYNRLLAGFSDQDALRLQQSLERILQNAAQEV